MRSVNLNELTVAETQNLLQHVVAPRPICFASTIDAHGNPNLSPFSFFNLFSANPPIVIFSPSRRVRDNCIKHTLENVLEVPEVVINIVDVDIIHQTSLASSDYPQGVNEFIKAGFTMQPALVVRPPMVKESKAKLECRVLEVKPLGNNGGAGNLVICEVLYLHLDQSILTDHGEIDPRKFKLVARLGGDWHCRIDERNLFQLSKPSSKLAIGIDALPDAIRTSKVLSGNDLARLAGVHVLPTMDISFSDQKLDEFMLCESAEKIDKIHLYVKQLLQEGKIEHAWQILLHTHCGVELKMT